MANESRVEQVEVGIAGADMKTEPRQFPANEPPPLAMNDKLSVVGKPIPRLDGIAKVTGQARYTADVNLPGMLYGKMITSPIAHGRIKSIDTSAAEKDPNVKAVHVLNRLVGVAQMKEEAEGKKLPMVRFAGQPIAAVAATSPQAAADAARLIKVEYEAMPFVVDVESARKDGAPVVFEGKAEQAGTAGGGGGPRGLEQKGNVRGPSKNGQGDIAKGFEEAEVIVEADYVTQVQTHSALETHGVVAHWTNDGLTVWASTQGTTSVRNEFAAALNLKNSQVRVICEYMGGGFGAKFGAGNWGILAAHLSKKAGAPVKLMLDRKEEQLCSGNRPSSMQKLKIGAKKDGTLTAIQHTNYGSAGTGTGAGSGRPALAMYTCPNTQSEEYDVFIHAGPAAAFRAPGHPQGVFAFEQAIDELAEKLGMDPLALREKIDPLESRRVERRIGAERVSWKNRKPTASDQGPVKRGLGVAQAIWHRNHNKESQVDLRLSRDGSVELLSAVQDIGTGIRTALGMVVAEELGIKPTEVTVKIGDTAWPPGPGSGGSVTTNSITPSARNAAYRIRRRLFEDAAGALGVGPDDLDARDGKVFVKADPTKSLSFKQACGKLKQEQISEHGTRSDDYMPPVKEGEKPQQRGRAQLGGVQFAEVTVDTRTGVIKVDRVVAVHDCGRPINPLTTESQVNGGVIQGLSYALYEDRILDRQMGLMVNPNLEQYKIAGSKEMPVIECVLIEQYAGRSSTDAAGIGEPATVPTAAAIANAVYNAIGVRIRQIPMTPAVVLKALSDAKLQSARSGQQ